MGSGAVFTKKLRSDQTTAAEEMVKLGVAIPQAAAEPSDIGQGVMSACPDTATGLVELEVRRALKVLRPRSRAAA